MILRSGPAQPFPPKNDGREINKQGATNMDPQKSVQSAEPRRTFMQTEAEKTSEPTQDRAGAKSMDPIDSPSLTAPHHDSRNASPVGATIFQGVTIEGEPGEGGSEVQVKSFAAKSRPMIGAASISDLVEILWQGSAAMKRPRALSRSATEPDDSKSRETQSITLPFTDPVKLD